MIVDALARPRIAPAAIALVGLSALAAAYTAQYGFGLEPCVLCLYQRVPYALALALGVIGVFALRPAGLQPLLVLIAGLTFLAGAGIAGYHVGVEQHWWAGTASCATPGFDANLSLEQLQRQLDEAASFVPCDEVAWSLFGISMAGYNLLASLALAAVCLLTAVRLRNPRTP
ncbi:MAG: disulfide bond formation protein B [Kiloniellales bacterium]|nr:disulfide bond formation protein B [Kiloniellales bacterium]